MDVMKFKRLKSLTINNREMMELASIGECVACSTVSDFIDLIFLEETAICPICSESTILPIYSDQLIDELRLHWVDATGQQQNDGPDDDVLIVPKKTTLPQY